MNNIGEQVADDNRKKTILQPVQQRIAFTAGCRLPHPHQTAQTIPIIHAHVIEITSMKIVLCILVQPRLVRTVEK